MSDTRVRARASNPVHNSTLLARARAFQLLLSPLLSGRALSICLLCSSFCSSSSFRLLVDYFPLRSSFFLFVHCFSSSFMIFHYFIHHLSYSFLLFPLRSSLSLSVHHFPLRSSFFLLIEAPPVTSARFWMSFPISRKLNLPPPFPLAFFAFLHHFSLFITFSLRGERGGACLGGACFGEISAFHPFSGEPPPPESGEISTLSGPRGGGKA